MSTLVELSEAKAYTRVTSSSEDTLMQTLLDGAEAFIEQYGGVSLSSVSFTENLQGGGTLLIPSRHPVTAVSSIVDEWAGETEASDSYEITEDYMGIRRVISGLSWFLGNPSKWGRGLGRYTVAYTAGYDGDTHTAPTSLKTAVLELVARHYRLRGGQTGENAQNLNITYASFQDFVDNEIMRLIGSARKSGFI